MSSSPVYGSPIAPPYYPPDVAALTAERDALREKYSVAQHAADCQEAENDSLKDSYGQLLAENVKLRAELREARSVTRNSRYVLVPREPTPRMLFASGFPRTSVGKRIWLDMIAAAEAK